MAAGTIGFACERNITGCADTQTVPPACPTLSTCSPPAIVLP
jgi:hypothetical protein